MIHRNDERAFILMVVSLMSLLVYTYRFEVWRQRQHGNR